MTPSNPLLPRAISFAMAAVATLSMLAGIDALAYTEHAASELVAQAAELIARLA